MVRDFCGHGVGRLFHDAPNILHYGSASEGVEMRPGMIFTIEPMINLGRPHVKVLSDGWTAVTRDRSLSAQYEHTVGVTADRLRDLHAVARQGSTGPACRPSISPCGSRAAFARTVCMADEGEDERGFFAEQPADAVGKARRRTSRSRIISAIASGCANAFATLGADALADYELLELLLFRSIPRADTKPLAKALLDALRLAGRGARRARPRCCRRSRASATPPRSISRSSRPPASAWRAASIKGREVLSSWTQVLDYCRAAMAFEEREQFRILFLDKKNALIADEVQQTGTVDHTPVYPREVVKRALELSATAIILVHNHPSGDPTPSRADIDMTKTIVETAKPLGIAVHDHIIIGKNGHASMKGLQLI